MRGLIVGVLLGLMITVAVETQGTLSPQVLRLLGRVNTWTAAQTFSTDPQFSEVHTAAPDSTACDVAGEYGKVYYDGTNDFLYWCSGASGWRKIATTSP